MIKSIKKCISWLLDVLYGKHRIRKYIKVMREYNDPVLTTHLIEIDRWTLKNKSVFTCNRKKYQFVRIFDKHFFDNTRKSVIVECSCIS